MIHNLPSFEHVDAQSIEQACSVLAEKKEQACIVGGGTDLLVRMKYRASAPSVVVNLKKISNLTHIEEKSNGDLGIGALTTVVPTV